MKHPFHVYSFDKSFLLVVVAITAIIIQVMDKSFGTTFTLSLGGILPRADILVFGLMILISITIQSVLIKKTTEAVKVKRSKSRVGQMVIVVAALLQYAAAGILVVILFQALFTLKYSVLLLETTVGINLITSSVILAILSSRFVRTFRYSHSKLVLAYTIAIASLSLSGIITFSIIEQQSLSGYYYCLSKGDIYAAVARLSKKPLLFRSFTGLAVSEFDVIANWFIDI